MMNESDYQQRAPDMSMDMLNATNYSTILNQEQSPEKLREFYK
jgi:lipoate-protein ligase A